MQGSQFWPDLGSRFLIEEFLISEQGTVDSAGVGRKRASAGESSPKIDLSKDSQKERDNMDEKKIQGKNSLLRVISPSRKNKRRKRQNDSRKSSKLRIGETGTSNK